ncbi:MAG TPA: hypothetical protein VK139_04870 [Microbacteriaceae bacterium]|nr:hypothetical protein [Microbacteriaceae bacterium]
MAENEAGPQIFARVVASLSDDEQQRLAMWSDDSSFVRPVVVSHLSGGQADPGSSPAKKATNIE